VFEVKPAGARGAAGAKVIQVIETRTFVGTGTEENPNRYVTRYWSLDGELLAEADPAKPDDMAGKRF